VSGRIALAVDGGNSKTDLALVREDGRVLAAVRGGAASPHDIGLAACVELLQDLHECALERAGLEARDGEPVAEVARVLLAGLDFPAEEQELRAALAPRRWARRLEVANDTFAVLRAGTERRWGVAVVCGAGINCVGVAPDGRHARFPALGAITGDWGGGYDVGLAALSAAARSEDRRGPRTVLESVVPAHFGLGTPVELAAAIHRGEIPLRRVVELAPVVFAHAPVDEVASGLVDRLVAEIVAFARVALERLGIERERTEVVLGGGILQHADGPLLEAIREGLRAVGDRLVIRPTAAPAIAGAALLGLDDLDAGTEAQARARAGLTQALEAMRPEQLAGMSSEGAVDG
jgi:N-acetylglucosamine kinase-like BadF-type ATPase